MTGVKPTCGAWPRRRVVGGLAVALGLVVPSAGPTLAAQPALRGQAAPFRDCPNSVPDSRIQGVGAEGVKVGGISCSAGYSLVRAWFKAAPHNAIVRGFRFSARNYVVTGKRGNRRVRFRLYGTD